MVSGMKTKELKPTKIHFSLNDEIINKNNNDEIDMVQMRKFILIDGVLIT